jgi:tetratricopeptide (TPR) repeat protein
MFKSLNPYLPRHRLRFLFMPNSRLPWASLTCPAHPEDTPRRAGARFPVVRAWGALLGSAAIAIAVAMVAWPCSLARAFYPDQAILAPWGWQRGPIDGIYQRTMVRHALEKVETDQDPIPLSFLLVLKEYPLALQDRQALLEEQERLARWYEAAGYDEEALSLYRRLLETDTDAPSALVSVWLEHTAALYYRQGNMKALVTLGQEYAKDKKDLLDDHFLYLLGQAFYRQGAYKEAEAALEAVGTQSDFFPFAAYTRAQISYKLGEPRRALDLLAACREALSGGEDQERGFLRDLATLTRARILHQEKRFQDAIEEYGRIGSSRLLFPDALMGIGWAYEALEALPKAIAYMKAVEQAGADARTLATSCLEAANLFARTRDYKAALDMYEALEKSIGARMDDLSACRQQTSCVDALVKTIEREAAPEGAASLQENHQPPRGAVPDFLSRAVVRSFFLSDRFKGLSERLDSLLAVRNRLADETLEDEQRPSRYVMDPFDKSAPSFLSEKTAQLLEAALTLFDLEIHTALVAADSGLWPSEKAVSNMSDAVAFWRDALWRLVLGGMSIEGLTGRIDTARRMVCKTPYPLEDRSTFLAKLVALGTTIQEVRTEVQSGEKAMKASLSRPWSHRRGFLLDAMIRYGRCLFLLRHVARQPLLLSLPLEPTRSSEAASEAAEREALVRSLSELRARSSFIYSTIEGLIGEEVRAVLAEEGKVLKTLAAETEYARAEALVQKDRAASLQGRQEESE